MKQIKTFTDFINESQIQDQQINSEINEFYELQSEIERLQSELKQKKAQFKEFDKMIQPVLMGMKETGDKLAVTETHVVKIKRFGYERTSSSYKDAYELALTKVNGATKKILDEALQVTQKVSTVKTSYTIDQLNEANILQKIGRQLKKWTQRFLKIFKKESKEIDKANKVLKDLS